MLTQCKFFEGLKNCALLDVLTRVEQHVCVPPSFLSSVRRSFQHRIEHFSHVIPSKALYFHFFIFAHSTFRNVTIVKFIPSDVSRRFTMFYIWIIVTTFWKKFSFNTKFQIYMYIFMSIFKSEMKFQLIFKILGLNVYLNNWQSCKKF